MEKQYLYNKIKGTLVAAGMGDAMGAPSEAWSRDEIIKNYAGTQRNDVINHYSNNLTLLLRETACLRARCSCCNPVCQSLG